MKTHCTPIRTALPVAIALSLLLSAASASAGPGDALSFNANNQYVAVTLASPPVNDYTVSAWVYLRAGGNMPAMRVGVLSAANCGESVELTIQSLTSSYTDPQYLMLGRCGMYNSPTSTNVVPLGQWVQVAVTVSNNYLVSYFIGGANAGTWTNSSGFNLALGTNITLADNTVRTFNGMLDEVQIWDIPLSRSQIQAGTNEAPNVPDPNLVAYWPFNEGTGTSTTADASGNGQTGTLINSPTWVLSGVPFVPDAATSAATGIGRTTATLNGTVNP